MEGNTSDSSIDKIHAIIDRINIYKNMCTTLNIIYDFKNKYNSNITQQVLISIMEGTNDDYKNIIYYGYFEQGECKYLIEYMLNYNLIKSSNRTQDKNNACIESIVSKENINERYIIDAINNINDIPNRSYKYYFARELVLDWIFRRFSTKYIINNETKSICFRDDRFIVDFPIYQFGNESNDTFCYTYEEVCASICCDNYVNYKDRNKKCINDEFSYETYYEKRENIVLKCISSNKKHINPSLSYYILDIMIAHKGGVAYGIFITDGCPLTKEKRQEIQQSLIYSDYDAKIFEISADQILKQKEPPETIEIDCLITKDNIIVSNKILNDENNAEIRTISKAIQKIKNRIQT
jgi:hypothetical protein